MKISFHGADRGVTGSCHLVECAGKKILVDCGAFQGGGESGTANAANFGFDPAAVDFLLLTHAHLDHCGRIPLLVKRGFKGEIVATAATRELARVVLLDSAHLQDEAARNHAHGGEPSAHASDEARPLYGLDDALAAFERFGRDARYEAPIDLAPGVRVTFVNAGHILGSASILMELVEGETRRRVLFSGDIGNSGRPLLEDPAPPAGVDVALMETTYGDRNHRPIAESVAELYAAIGDAFGRGGNVVIPTFGIERAQDLLYYLREGAEAGKLPSSMHVFLDSPMAISATEIFRRHPESLRPQIAELFREGADPLRPPGLVFTRDKSESVAINRISGGAIIMAGSGMATGGRVLHHLRHNLARPQSAIVFVGFAAEGTLAREIIDGAREATIAGDRIPVKAQIHTINGFSAHADQTELLAWRRRADPKRTILVHGEDAAMNAFVAKLDGAAVERPTLGQEIDL